MPGAGFSRRKIGGLVVYSCSHLDRMAGLRHGFSTRHGGVSAPPARSLNLSTAGWDLPEYVAENRRRFLSALHLAPESLTTVSQVHSGEFHIINGDPHQWNPRTPGDALATLQPGSALAVLVADCFPLLIADPQTGAIAAIHAGWRGVLAGIVPRTLAGMRQDLGVDPSGAVVAIGPGIRKCCLEVGSEVAPAFDHEFADRAVCAPRAASAGKYLLDLPLALNRQLEAAGISRGNVHDLGLCTRCHRDEFFSYRAEGDRAGRLMAVICRDQS